MQAIPFNHIDWTAVPALVSEGEAGFATAQELHFGGLRIRMMRYSPGYLADHWCRKGHIVHCLEGGVETQMEEGSSIQLTAGQSYVVSDEQSSHRSFSPDGATLLIIDGDFLANE